MKKFSMANLAYLLGLIKTLVETAVTNVTNGYKGLVGEIGEGKTVKGYVDDKVTEINGTNTALANRVSANETAISKIDGDASTEGSFRKYFADMVKADGGLIDKIGDVINWFSGLSDESQTGAQLLADVAAHKTAIETTLPNAISTAESNAKSHAETKASEAEANAEAYALGLVGESDTAGIRARIKANEDNIAAINNETTGILAVAKADATSKANTAEANAKSYADQQIEAIAAYTDEEILAAWNEVFGTTAA